MLKSEAIEAIEAIVQNRGIAEVKEEHGQVVIVEISRKIKHKESDSAEKTAKTNT